MIKIFVWTPKMMRKCYGLDLDMVTILYQLIACFVSYLRRSGLVGKSDHLRSIYLEGMWEGGRSLKPKAFFRGRGGGVGLESKRREAERKDSESIGEANLTCSPCCSQSICSSDFAILSPSIPPHLSKPLQQVVHVLPASGIGLIQERICVAGCLVRVFLNASRQFMRFLRSRLLWRP